MKKIAKPSDGWQTMGSRLVGAIQRRLQLGYDPSATCVCDGCHRKFTGHRYVAPPIHRRLPDHMVDLLCPRCAKGRRWTPPFDPYKETKHGH